MTARASWKPWGALVAALAFSAAAAQQGWCGWQSYSTADGLVDKDVYALLEDRSGNLWFGTESGVSRYDGMTWTNFTTAEGLVHNGVKTICEDHLGNLWFGTYAALPDGSHTGGVSRYDGTTWRSFTTADGLADNWVFSIVEDRSGNLWFGTPGGASRYDGATWRTFTTADGLPDNNVGVIHEDRSGKLWCGTCSGASRYDGTSWTTFREVGCANNILEDRSGNLWFGGWGIGLIRYDGAAWQSFTTADGLAAMSSDCSLEDRSGNLWFGMRNQGVSRYDGAGWRTFTTADGLSDDYVFRILEDRSGALWFGTYWIGVSRYDGVNWRTFTTADGLGNNQVLSMLEDRSGALWFGTYGGVSRYDGTAWRTFTTADGLAERHVSAICEDRAGHFWFGTWYGGVSRYDGATWRTFTIADGLADTTVYAILEDGSGNLWFGTPRGASRYDGSTWRTFTTADGLTDSSIRSIFEDRSGSLWFGTLRGGVSRYDGASWRTFTTTDGLADNHVRSIFEDRSGSLWFGTAAGGVSRFDGSVWRSFAKDDGLVENNVSTVLEDRAGDLWFGTVSGLSRYEPDHVPPQTVFLSVPPRVTASTDHNMVFVAAFGETKNIEFSWRLDAGRWSEWSRVGNAFLPALAQGPHVFEARSRDFLLNTEETPARAVFEIDAVPPAPVIASPTFGQAVKAQIEVRGTAADARFVGYRLMARLGGSASWDPPHATLLAESPTPVSDGPLGSWDTSTFADGLYEVRLAVTDSLGLVGTGQVTVVVDNHEPSATITSPARVTAEAGGDVYTTNAEAHLYIPPRGLAEDAVVTLAGLGAGDVPAVQPGGAALAYAGYRLAWGGVVLRKPATLEISYAGSEAAGQGLALYVAGADSVWRRLGGTVDATTGKISLAVTEEGRYALYAEVGSAAGLGGLASLSLTPRVFSARGTYANADVGIGFTLGRAGAVTVKVYNRAGRLTREVVAGRSFGPGANLVRWDGRDRDGAIVEPGLYIVSVEALGETQSRPVAVVR